MKGKEKHLYYLKEMKDYKVINKDEDIRGWKIKDLDNRVIGVIEDLLINLELGKAVYVDVLVDKSIIDADHDPFAPGKNQELREFVNQQGENHIIVPIGLIELNKKEKYAFTDSINYDTFSSTKRYKTGDTISRDYEETILASFRSSDSKDQSVRKKTEILEQKWQEDHLDDLKRQESPETSSEYESYENLPEEPQDRDRSIEKKRNAELHRELYPEKTGEDEPDWDYENPRPGDKDPYRKRRRTNKEAEDAFYDRREFRQL